MSDSPSMGRLCTWGSSTFTAEEKCTSSKLLLHTPLQVHTAKRRRGAFRTARCTRWCGGIRRMCPGGSGSHGDVGSGELSCTDAGRAETVGTCDATPLGALDEGTVGGACTGVGMTKDIRYDAADDASVANRTSTDASAAGSLSAGFSGEDWRNAS
eukprot:scaffold79875_cov23-Tisochrysis_lutea.AAC.4